MLTDSEEERKELEKIKLDIIKYLQLKDEPLTIMQLSYGTKYAKQYCDEAMVLLIAENKCKRKEINKNTIVFSLVSTEQLMAGENMELVMNLLQVETDDQELDVQIAQLEKDIKEIKLQPTTQEI